MELKSEFKEKLRAVADDALFVLEGDLMQDTSLVEICGSQREAFEFVLALESMMDDGQRLGIQFPKVETLTLGELESFYHNPVSFERAAMA